uniref:Uncharacterized protein n=1 Tax=Cacopsylla melanoneura TaxID=428564 RepID=A0A8D8Y5J3_9HEMI
MCILKVACCVHNKIKGVHTKYVIDFLLYSFSHCYFTLGETGVGWYAGQVDTLVISRLLFGLGRGNEFQSCDTTHGSHSCVYSDMEQVVQIFLRKVCFLIA